MTSTDPGFVVLTNADRIERLTSPRETSEMWRQVTKGEQVFIAGSWPNQLGYWYRKARADGFNLQMFRANVNGNPGTVMQREYPAP